MNLHPGEARLLDQVREAGEKGVKWTQGNSGTAVRLIQRGLIECRMDPIGETEGGLRTGIRYVATNDRKLQRN